MKNKFLEEIWAARQRISRDNGYDLRRTVKYLHGLETDYPGRVVAFKPRKPNPIWLSPAPNPEAALREEPPPYGRKSRKKS